ncbi:hypothetical protein M8C21_025372, partial [Ambrosia artemisiifolia]
MASVEVPLIDMEKVDGLPEELVKAAEGCGCFRIVNHGVPPQLMAEMKAVAVSLFDLPKEIHGMGYIGRGLITPFFESLSIDDIVSLDDLRDNKLDVSTHQLETIYKYIKAIREVAGLIGRKLMEGSGLEGDLFDGWLCQLRMNKYHFSEESVGLPGGLLHTDPSFLTILQDDENVNGLQIVDKLSGEFVPLDHVPGTLIVNIGELAKVWSNGRYYCVNHIASCIEPKIRFSIALFMLAPKDKKIEAPSKFVDSDHPRLYAPFDYREYVKVRKSTREFTG